MEKVIITSEDVQKVLTDYVNATDPLEAFQYASQQELEAILQNNDAVKAIAILANMAVQHIEKELPASDGWGWSFEDEKNLKLAAVYDVLCTIHNGRLWEERRIKD